MSIRLIEMKRILKDTGSIYLHCDNTIGQYLKSIMDIIFGYENFRNSIIWRIGWVSGYKTQKKGFIRNHEIIYYYVKSSKFIFNKTYISYPENYLRRDGKKPTGKGIPIEDTWNCHDQDTLNSIMIQSFSREKVGYPTQKPLALLKRVITSSSNEGDIVLDPFCGCATTCVASERLNRKWIGIDINKQAFYMNYYRMSKMGILGNIEQGSFKGDLYLAKKIPVRNDISNEELKKIEINLNEKKKIKQTNKVKLSSKEKEIVKELLYENQAGMCNGCDVYMRSVELTIDHIKPQAKEGDDDLDNLQLLCHRCNIWKSAKDMKYLLDKLLQENIISAGTYNRLIDLHIKDYKKDKQSRLDFLK